MELFAKQIVNNLKPFKGLRLLSECKPSPLQGGRYFRSHYQWCFKHLSSKSLKSTSEAVDFLLRFRLGNYSFTKKEVIHWCSWLHPPPAALQTADKVGSFVRQLFWHQNYFGIDYPHFQIYPSIIPYPSTSTEVFSTTHYSLL